VSLKRLSFLFSSFLIIFFLLGQLAIGQTTISTGSITGVITDQTGAVVPGVVVKITNKDTGQSITVAASSTGVYNSGALIPGNYTVMPVAKGFKSTQVSVAVQVGVTSTANIKLEIGESTTVVEVQAQAVTVNTQQATVQGVINSDQIQNLPVNGRNFLDLAQLEPGVQIQDGSNFDPTKVGYSSISFGGRFGRTARIEVDGVDVSDETVGTTTEDIPAISISQFQTEQSTLDPSTELTSSGAVNVDTKHGTNKFHGDADGLFRGNQLAAALPSPAGFPTSFQRTYEDGDFGGPIMPSKLFFYLSGTHILQHENAGVPQAAPFTSFNGFAPLPFKEYDSTDRLDWQGPHGLRMFYRFSYFKNLVDSAFGAVSYQIYKNEDITRQDVVGADFNTGLFTHSFRFSYLKFQNNIGDAVRGSNLPLANYPVSIQAGTLFTGPNLLAPQETPQSDHQFKYDGSRIYGNHILRYGVDFNHIQGGGYAKFFGIDPTVVTLQQSGTADYTAAIANCPSTATEQVQIGSTTLNAPIDPTCYPADTVQIGNGQGFSSEQAAFGFPLGGLGPDNRLGLYIGDNWRVVPTFTVIAGLRYDRDSGRTDSDLNPPLLQSAVNAILPGLGNPVRQANKNFGPQLGFAWNVAGHGNTVIRGGAGVFYENVIYNNVLFDRPLRLATGQFLQFPVACSFGAAFPVAFGPVAVTGPGGTFQNQSVTVDQFFGNTGPSICGDDIGAGSADFAAFQTAYQKSSSGAGADPSFVPSLLASGAPIPTGMFAPDYRTPRSYQFNIGVQRQLARGMVLSVDYIRNIGERYTLGIDENHSGDVRFFDLAAAQAAIATTLADCGVATIDQSIASAGCPTDPANGTNDNGTYAARPATIADYAGHGLDSPGDLGVQQCNNALGFSCAFPGINPAAGNFPMLEPIGRSVYNGLQVKLTTQVQQPFRGLHDVNFVTSYALSRFTSCGSANPTGPGSGDQDFVLTAISNANPCGFSGPEALDRTNQLSFGGYFDLPYGIILSPIAHFDSPLPNSLVVPSGSVGAIYQTDFTGDGTPTGQLVPGTKIGEFDRGISAAQLNNVINNYNTTIANLPTPAGQTLIQNGLFTEQQLQQLGGVAPFLPLAPLGQSNMSWLRTFDVKLGWRRTFMEHYTIEPSFSAYNLFNFANFDPTVSPMSGLLTGSPCAINGTVRQPDNCPSDRVGLGTGVYAQGAPRTLEFGLDFSF
jgi:hypothetical protein